MLEMQICDYSKDQQKRFTHTPLASFTSFLLLVLHKIVQMIGTNIRGSSVRLCCIRIVIKNPTYGPKTLIFKYQMR